MKLLKYLNNSTVVIQISLIAFSFIDHGIFLGALIFSAVTGTTQVLIALALVFENKNRSQASFYLFLVLIYFQAHFMTGEHESPLSFVFFMGTPVVLAIYLTYIVNKKQLLWTN